MSIPIEAVIDRPGQTPLRLTPLWESLRFSTAAVGGFSSASFSLPGDPARWKRELPHLAMVRLVYDTQVIWEGQLEDITLKLLDGSSAATVNCFGLQRLLSQTSVRRMWSKRDFQYVPRSTTQVAPDPAFEMTTGQFLSSDLTKVGLQVAGNGGTAVVGKATGSVIIAPDGIIFRRVMGTREKAGNANLLQQIWSAQDGATFTSHLSSAVNTTTTFDLALVAFANTILFTANTSLGFVTAVTDYVRWYDVRVLGTSLTEDASGGFYGGSILRDLIGLVPGLSIGIIDDGSDYTIPSIDRAVRAAALDVVSEVAGYYTREWRVWEDGRFDWRAVNKDEPQWVMTLADLADGSELTTTVGGHAETLYVQYVDPASGLDAEASSSSTSQRNPFVKQGKSSDVIVPAGVPMTSDSATQLATKLIGDVGNYPPVQGRLLLPATKVIRRASGSPLPALMIRGGDNVVVADLPKTELFSQGRDGETLMHVVSTETDLGTAMTTLEVEGQANRADVILARLAASTRSLTG